MSSTRQNRIEQFVGMTLPLDAAAQARALDEFCGGDTELRSEIEEVLQNRLAALAKQARPKQEVGRFAPGTLLSKRFRITRYVARGGMGEVYEASDLELQGKHIALKTLRPDIGREPGMRQRFEREVLLAQEISHPNVCPTHAIFVSEEFSPPLIFLTMRFIRGESLLARIQRGGSIPLKEGEQIVSQMAGALGAAHAAGVIHRDFKPGNVMLEGGSGSVRVFVTDFGLAHSWSPDSDPDETRHIQGTAGYIAPEIYQGNPATPASDVYAFGVVVHEVIVGQKPMPKPGRTHEFVRPSMLAGGIPSGLDRMIRGCLEADPANRFQSIEEALAARDGVESKHVRLARPRLLSRRTWLSVSAASAAALAGGFYLGAPFLENLFRPLPSRRFVAIMGWPVPAIGNQPLLGQILDILVTRLARAEAYDKELLVIRSNGAKGEDETPINPPDAMGILGANLVLAASVESQGERADVRLAVIDPATTSVLRQERVKGRAGDFKALGNRVASTAARLLEISARAAADPNHDDVLDVPASAYRKFQDAEARVDEANGAGLDAAIELYQKAIDEAPHFGLAYARLSLALAQRSNLFHDPPSLRLAVRNANLASRYSPDALPTIFCWGMIELYSGQSENALKTLGDVISRDPGNTKALFLEAQAFRSLNLRAQEEQIYKRLLIVRPNYWPAYNEQGLNLIDRGEYQQAADLFSQAGSLAPKAALPWANLGLAYLLLGQNGEARNAFERSNANRPNEISLVNLGNLAWTDKSYEKALSFYKKASVINPHVDTIWRNIGDCYQVLHQPALVRGNYQRASLELTNSIKAGPALGSDWMTLSYYSAKLGDLKGAREQLTRAESLGVTDLEGQLLKVQILVLLGDKNGAAQLLSGLISKGISRVSIDLAMDLQPLKTDPRFRGIFKNN